MSVDDYRDTYEFTPCSELYVDLEWFNIMHLSKDMQKLYARLDENRYENIYVQPRYFSIFTV